MYHFNLDRTAAINKWATFVSSTPRAISAIADEYDPIGLVCRRDGTAPLLPNNDTRCCCV